VASTASASLSAGAVAIVGFQAAGVPTDNIAFAALVDLAPGTVLYFTDNGWTGTGFRGVSGTDSDGNESLMKFTVGANGLAAGSIISSVSTNANAGVWTLSGPVGTGTSAFQQLALSQAGDQVTVFTSTNSTNPMFSGFTSLWNFDNTGAYENATSSSTGSLAPGLSFGSATLLSATTNYAVFNFSDFSSGTTEEWAARFANASNWTTGSATTDMVDGSFIVIPSPGAIALLGVAGLASRRRR
jgi:hypothetical protein